MLCLLAMLAFAADLEDLVEMTPDERRDHLAEVFVTSAGDMDLAARASAALAVSDALSEAGRDDPSVVRLFLAAAWSDDPGMRRAAVEAARADGDPPTAPGQPDPTSGVLKRGALTPASRELFGNRYQTSEWTVYHSDGTPLTVSSFAEMVGEPELLQEMTKEGSRRDAATGVMTVGILTAGVGSVWAAVALENEETDLVGPVLVHLLGGALIIGGIGGMVSSSGNYDGPVDARYDPEQTEALIETYNAGVTGGR